MSTISGSTNKTTSDGRPDLWKDAYKKMKHDPDGKKLLDKFQKVVGDESKQMGHPIGHFRTEEGRKQLLALINEKAKPLKSNNGTVDKVVKTMLKAKDVVMTGASASPAAAVAVAGLFMAFSIQQAKGNESQAMSDCTILVAKIISRRAVEDSQIHSNSPLESPQLKDLRQSLQFSYQDLYSMILTTVYKLVCKLDSRARWLDNLVGWSDWAGQKQALQDAEEECVRDLEAIHRYKADPASQPSVFRRSQRNLLHEYASMGLLWRVVPLVESGSFDVNAKTRQEWTALCLAAGGGHLETVKFLIQVRGIDLNAQNKEGQTALHIATKRNRIAVAGTLARAGAKIDVRDRFKRTAFLDAARDGRLAILKILKEKGANINQVSGTHGWSALHMAAENDRVEMVKYLLDNKIKKNLKIKGGNKEGLTAREVAEKSGSKKVLELLK